MLVPYRRHLRVVFATAVAAAAAVLLGGSTASAQPVTVQNATIGTQPRDIVYNAEALRPFVLAAKNRRVDIAGIGDSNQVAGENQNYGWDHGYTKAWTDRYGEYATGVYGMNSTGGWPGQGYLNSWGYPYGAASNNAPADLHKYKLFTDSNGDNVNDFPPSYAYFGPTYQEPIQWVPLVTISKDSSLFGQNLRWQMTYATFDSGAGKFTPSLSSWGTPLYQAQPVSTSTGTLGLKDGAFKIPAAAYAQKVSNPDMQLGLSFPGSPSMKGPFFGLWQRVEGEKQTGVAYSTMLWQGGRALVHAATSLQQQSDDALKEYVRNLVKLQGGDKMLLVQVNHGQNDPGWGIPSVGPLKKPSDTADGFADNMDALITRLRGVWSSMGYAPENLMFQYGPYHSADGAANDGTGRTIPQRLADYENALVTLSQQHPEYNLAVVRGTRMITPKTMKANNWFVSATDNAHLNAAGYIGLSEMAVRQVIGYAAPEELASRSAVTSLSFRFNSDVSAALTPDDLLIYDVGGDTLLDPFDLAVDWNAATLTATWTFGGLPLGELPAGDYEAILKTSQLGPLAGSEGTTSVEAGKDYVFSFTASPVVPEPASVGGAAILVFYALARRSR